MARKITFEEWKERLSHKWELLEIHGEQTCNDGCVCKCVKCGHIESFSQIKRLHIKDFDCLHCEDKLLTCDCCEEKFALERVGTLNTRDYCYKCVPLGEGYDRGLKYKRQLEKAKNLYGSKCVICGFEEDYAIEFHHKEPGLKEEALSNMFGRRSWKQVKNELDKCVVVCSNCHKGIHSGKLVLPE